MRRAAHMRRPRRHGLRNATLGFLAGAGATGGYYRRHLRQVGQAVKQQPVALRFLRRLKKTHAGRRLLEKGLATKVGQRLTLHFL